MMLSGPSRRLSRLITAPPRYRCLHASSRRLEKDRSLKLASSKSVRVQFPDETPQQRYDQLSTSRWLDRMYPRVRSRAARGEHSAQMHVKDFLNTYNYLLTNDFCAETVNLSGRIRSIRAMSSKLIFYDIQEDGHVVQVMHNYKDVGMDVEEFKEKTKLHRVGDLVNVTGNPRRTQTGALTLQTSKPLRMLAPCLRQLPDHIDVESALHRRHLELLTNPVAPMTLRVRSALLRAMREYFHEHNFTEVETPILSYSSGGAVAKPFMTEATASMRGRPLALRIAPELWLKRLVVGGMERVYEIGPQFRNEHIDATHNPEFTTCEFYMAYHNLEALMEMTQDMFRTMHQAVQDVVAQNPKWEKLIKQPGIDWSQPFQVIDFIPKLEELLGEKLPDLDNTPQEELAEKLKAILEARGVEVPPKSSPAKLLDKLASHYLEPLCDVPTFILYHPEILSPLSKGFDHLGRKCSLRFELFVNGRELANAYEEENDPAEQRRKFLIQANGGEIDEGYIEALEYGLPPTAGWGCGIDRLVMLFTGAKKINEVQAFGGLRGAVNQGGEWTYQKPSAQAGLEGVKETNEDGEVVQDKPVVWDEARILAEQKIEEKRARKKAKREAGMRWLAEKQKKEAEQGVQ